MTPNDTQSHLLMDIETVQKTLGRSRASVYRYANSDPNHLNLPYDPQMLNPELRRSKNDPLLFHPNEVARFARDILRIKSVIVHVQEPAVTQTTQLLQDILQELRLLRQLVEEKP